MLHSFVEEERQTSKRREHSLFQVSTVEREDVSKLPEPRLFAKLAENT